VSTLSTELLNAERTSQTLRPFEILEGAATRRLKGCATRPESLAKGCAARGFYWGEGNARRTRYLITTLPAAIVRTSATRDSKTPRALSIADTTYSETTKTTEASMASMTTALRPQGRRSAKHVSPPAPIPSTEAKKTLTKNITVAALVGTIRYLPCRSWKPARGSDATARLRNCFPQI